MLRVWLLCALLPVFLLRGGTRPECFSEPKSCTREELSRELSEKTLDMSWEFGNGSHLRFLSREQETYFELYLEEVPEIYAAFLARMRDKFVEGTRGLLFSYGLKGDGTEERNIPRPSFAKEGGGLVAERRVVEGAHPQAIGLEALAAVIRDQEVLFYTGAGISLAAGVPAMKGLQALLGLEEGEGVLFSLEGALENPRAFASKIELFRHACLFSAPTAAHRALRELALFKRVRIVTENLDSLHEASGVCPYRVNDPVHVRDEALTRFDYLVCVGLSGDHRGFIGWYKQQNPQGRIISIDLQQPSYLGDEDFLLVGDAQEVLPALQGAVLSPIAEAV